MRTIIVHSGRDASTILRLAPGEEITFGRGAPEQPVDLRVDDPAVSRMAGSVHAVEDYWRLSNRSRTATYVVENPEGGGEFVKVPPGRVGTPVPFEIAQVLLPVEGGWTKAFTVMAPEHTFAVSALGVTGEPTRLAHSLDPTAKYFLVLVALCEPRLRDPSSAVIPSVPQILSRLDGLGLTRSAVNFHIDYLAREKLRVKQPSHDASQGKADWQRGALISVALRFDLVRDEHLALLP
ncbi:FHA domain-containing protein [Thermomonospora umbrina]|uniref:FHA domain-containing protein n=1 Tax=Thermomonospora umbrina TaxID=111806 RepID=UPI000E23B3D6|nr:FHA domain-containing protein [Thermomonospora umbrina]